MKVRLFNINYYYIKNTNKQKSNGFANATSAQFMADCCMFVVYWSPKRDNKPFINPLMRSGCWLLCLWFCCVVTSSEHNHSNWNDHWSNLFWCAGCKQLIVMSEPFEPIVAIVGADALWCVFWFAATLKRARQASTEGSVHQFDVIDARTEPSQPHWWPNRSPPRHRRRRKVSGVAGDGCRGWYWALRRRPNMVSVVERWVERCKNKRNFTRYSQNWWRSAPTPFFCKS